MKFGTLLFLLTFSTISKAGEIENILSSPTPKCIQAKKIYQELKNKRIEDRSNYIITLFDVYGTNAEDKEVILTLTRSYQCNWGSFGGGGCQDYYSCSIEVY